jgi:hypothetical protein
MTVRGGRFEPEELQGSDSTPVSDLEVAAALSTARDLERAAAADAVQPSPDFTKRVMAAIEREPRPAAGGAFVLRATSRVVRFATSLREAWALAVGGSGRPIGARATALAYVLVVAIAAASITGVAAVGAAGALGLLGPARTSPPPTEPRPTPRSTPEPSPSTAPAASPDPSASPTASSSTEPIETGEANQSPDPTASASPTGSDRPDESETPDPSSTPDASDTPEPSGSDSSGPG